MKRRSLFKAAFAGLLAVLSKPSFAWSQMPVAPVEKLIVFLNSWDIKETEYEVIRQGGWVIVKLKEARSVKKGEHLTLSVHTLNPDGVFTKLSRSCTYYADRDCDANVGVMWQGDSVMSTSQSVYHKRSYWV